MQTSPSIPNLNDIISQSFDNSTVSSTMEYNLDSFHKYLVKKHCEENLLFMINSQPFLYYYEVDIDEGLKLPNKYKFPLDLWINSVYSQFIKINAPQQCNLSENIRSKFDLYFDNFEIPKYDDLLEIRHCIYSLLQDNYLNYISNKAKENSINTAPNTISPVISNNTADSTSNTSSGTFSIKSSAIASTSSEEELGIHNVNGNNSNNLKSASKSSLIPKMKVHSLPNTNAKLGQNPSKINNKKNIVSSTPAFTTSTINTKNITNSGNTAGNSNNRKSSFINMVTNKKLLKKILLLNKEGDNIDSIETNSDSTVKKSNSPSFNMIRRPSVNIKRIRTKSVH
ncbi:GTPase-activating protein RGS2 SCDLUD_002907 [Saccharomycodes ludwigii]|uniref:GTPase-activating protein RGS2 n=1 Tax=Saccharomycodes ludwigii TaxID=36035 RepID=UPI001E85EE92|nr:hypothetical protein SCDLUD_002907 [Saccharomycodes ludwigii]KAH3901415.1 hypothetical protein SCDLUD_002907 [Saccharomycodes ludwigii]